MPKHGSHRVIFLSSFCRIRSSVMVRPLSLLPGLSLQAQENLHPSPHTTSLFYRKGNTPCLVFKNSRWPLVCARLCGHRPSGKRCAAGHSPPPRFEAITSRPLLLAGVAHLTEHAGQASLLLTLTHAAGDLIKSMVANVRKCLDTILATAPQLTQRERWMPPASQPWASPDCLRSRPIPGLFG